MYSSEIFIIRFTRWRTKNKLSYKEVPLAGDDQRDLEQDIISTPVRSKEERVSAISGGEDVYHLVGDDSTGLPAIATLHECILDSGHAGVFIKVFQSISLNLEVTLDKEVYVIGGGKRDVVLFLVLRLGSSVLRVFHMVSKESDSV